MVKWLTISFLIICTFGTNAQVKVKSYYFKAGTSVYTDASKKDIDSFELLNTKKSIQIIEINGFVEESESKKAKRLASSRIDTFVNQFNLLTHEITINNYGNKKERVPFEVMSWDRIDVYYHIDDFGITIVEKETSKRNDKDTSERRMMELPEKVKEERDEVTFGAPQVIPIEFKGGTSKVLKESLHYLDALVDTMENNTFLTAQIRGHVCCGNNQRISEKRAKAVYKYLVKNGIESHRLTFKGYSNTLPLVFPERTQADRAKNRRVDIIFNNGSNVVIDD
jgi:outer membrane protein OmpA-like peptidoglycan-associated protein